MTMNVMAPSLSKNFILVVDDEINVKRLLEMRFRKRIRAGEMEFLFAQNGVEAINTLKTFSPVHMVLTDIRMPEMDGLTLLEKLEEMEIPLRAVVVSAYGDMKNIRAAMNRGAFDFLTKPFDFEDLEATIDKTLQFVRRLSDQQNQLQGALDRLRYLVFFDQLTNLLSRTGFLQQLANAVEAHRTEGRRFAVIMLDLERYGIIKSSFGHELSDQLLQETAQRLNNWKSAHHQVARVGEDIFAVLLNDYTDLASLNQQTASLRQKLEVAFQLGSVTVLSLTHFGMATSELPYSQPEDFLRAADTALNTARRQAHAVPVVFDISMQRTAIHRLQLEVELQKAISTAQIQLYFQPVLDVNSQRLVGFEALARWQHPVWGWVPPGEFIPLAEETGLIVPLGEHVLVQACRQLQVWKKQFPQIHDLYMAINLSSRQLLNSDLLADVINTLQITDLRGEALKLEITESVLMSSIEQSVTVLNQLKGLGISLSIDDFGTGYSSLAYLQSLPLTSLKVDRSFVRDIESNRTSFDITSTIITLAHHLKLDIVAEGIETESQLKILRALGCEYGQGFLFSRPLDTPSASRLIEQLSMGI
jgi:diguanylate cyclase (GGDEF)-like protein